MGTGSTSFNSTGLGNNSVPSHSLATVRRKLVIRALGATLLIAIIALVASQQATSSPNSSTASKADHSVKFDVVHNSSNEDSISGDSTVTSDVDGTSNNSSQGANARSNTSINVSVNGQVIDVPANGTTQQTITSPDGSTSVNITTTNSGNDINTSFNSTTVDQHTNTSTYNNSSHSSFEHSFGGSP